jgi:hypothetical protein
MEPNRGLHLSASTLEKARTEVGNSLMTTRSYQLQQLLNNARNRHFTDQKMSVKSTERIDGKCNLQLQLAPQPAERNPRWASMGQ